jgi:hypothetical protein
VIEDLRTVVTMSPGLSKTFVEKPMRGKKVVVCIILSISIGGFADLLGVRKGVTITA